MKKLTILTSILALAACSTGGGEHNPGHPHGGSSAPVTPYSSDIAIQSFANGSGTVNADNAELTNMSSFTTTYNGESSVADEMVNYVNERLSGTRGILNSRAATNRTMRADNQGFSAADARITRMKQVLYDMAHLSGDALTNYVTEYKDRVLEALVLYVENPADLEVNSGSSPAELISAFNDTGITADNAITKFDAFDTDNFHFTKEKLADVRLRDTGQDAYFKFGLDEGGAITTVSLWENPTSEYGSSWANKRIVIVDGVAVAQTSTNLNPFGAEYLNSDAGDLVRNGKSFTNTMHHYEFNLGEHNISGAVIDEDEFEDVEINSNTVLTLDQAKQKLKDYIIAKVNKKLHNQNGGTETQEDLDSFVAVANYYIAKIDAITAADVTNSHLGTFTQTATMDGLGKDENLKLKYSDFGYSTMVRDMGEHGTETQYLTYVGGYETRKMDNSILNDDLDGATFTGTAIVTVEDKHEDKDHPTNNSLHTALYKDTGAQLQYDITGSQATHTLTMNNLKAVQGGGATNGSDWYSTIVTGTTGAGDTSNVAMHFDATDKNIDSTFRFFEVNDGVVSRTQNVVRTDGVANNINSVNGTAGSGDYANNYRLHADMSAEYYGDNPNAPSEATSGFHMDERYHSDDNNIQHELSMYGAFGAQKDGE